MTGIVGNLVTEMACYAFPNKNNRKEFMNNFLKREDISKCVYQGSNSFEGNQARKLLCVYNKL